MNDLKKILWRIFGFKKKCKYCENQFCIGNYGPCYSCYKYSNFVDYRTVKRDKDIIRIDTGERVRKDGEK